MYGHVGDCWNAGRRCRGTERDRALRALAEGGPGLPAVPPGQRARVPRLRGVARG
ncbi:DUF6233 domain-containing protein [Streptomyces afghaniensis]|uniref:DUF6233 domain-containing protein n=1 Tax=Streptomyces afghaniensis TaxID=66865 RepID=UPI0033AFB821